MARKTKTNGTAMMARLYEVAAVIGPTALAERVGLSVAGVYYWARKGISRKAAEKLQAELGWSADYIMDGIGPPLIGEDSNVSVEVIKRKPNGADNATQKVAKVRAVAEVTAHTMMNFSVVTPLSLKFANAGDVMVRHEGGELEIFITPRD